MQRFLLSAAIMALFSTPVFAQTMGDIYNQYEKLCTPPEPKGENGDDIIFLCHPDYNSDEIVVTASRIGFLGKDDNIAPVSIINKYEIENSTASTLADILRTIAGLSISRSGPVGGLTQARLRGTEANHVLVLIDGVEASNPNTGEFNFANIRKEDIIRIEVLRGEQSALWGADAIGGVINIISRAGNIDETYKLSLEAGSFNSVQGQLSAIIPIKNASLSINGNAFQTDGIDVSGLGGEKDGAKSRNINLGLNELVFGKVKLSGKYSAAHTIAEFDADTNFDGRLDNTNAVLKTDTKLARATANFAIGGFDNKINLAATNTRQFTTGTSFRNDITGERLQLNWAAKKQFGAHNITILAETEHESFANFGGVGALQNQSHNISNNALAADYLYSKNAITLTASVRADFNDRFNNSQAWRVGTGYKLAGIGGRVRASIGTGVKNPTMTELFGFFPGSFVPNPNLSPEKSSGFNIGYEQKISGFNIGIDYFKSDLEDEIYTIFNPDFTSSIANRQTKSKREGLEMEAYGYLSDNLHLRAQASFLKAKENGVREIRRPEFSAGANAVWQASRNLSLSLSANYTGSQYDMDFATFSRVKLDGFTLVGFNAKWAANEFLTLYLRGENMLDTDYREVVGYAAQGRGVYAGIKADF